MKIIIIGPHGSGKTTIGRLLSKHYSIPFLSSGEIVREYAKTNENIRVFLEKKEYVPDEFVNRIIVEFLSKKEYENGFVLEGYPRNINQLNYFLKYFTIDVVVNLIVDEKILIDRLLYRLVCPNCKENYNIKLKPPRKNELCDKCNVKLEKRIEDNFEGIMKRNEEFRDKTLSVIEKFREMGKVVDVDVSSTDVNENLKSVILKIDEFREIIKTSKK
ncbi:MAG: nucleoside monophosphate kinase [Candidatus Aenigmarchaeota archaeon]|nr:nucleoside monophosphate kinase [Candidatus Aenigmarchaeota archaeon]MDW8149334.1 nucleoside monophosphate kinase [Candidatus Aenigmarchaeota archaeon]